MIALLQRVTQAQVRVADDSIAEIERGLLVFVGIEKNDGESQTERLLQRVLAYRVFPDAEDKMNRSLTDIDGALLLVPQFTLVADTRKGNRPSFDSAASPAQGEQLFDFLLAQARHSHAKVACGRFGADMQIHLVNDGPVTFSLQVN